ncbi:adenosylhomocysteine nucleosidase [Salsuginibacillus halophilus]|uniref:5'-methylthioadenosine/S-adenosylhomocysteine nucleosidase n=1 Tax=Salsuginibacillus halophilus TaxID=517424 RepID=A0A2P8HFS8_9BACI|nr:5'-methylthioadenosine/S-adenosylhomocysteine nucleosidase [Salsuginibacillus halophilus]PSL45076.1 adenosylhomocysteine nucleosidase [Salsuginibacillus halophilus]
MTIAIIGAMEEEVELLYSQMEEVTETNRAGSSFYEGRLKGKDVVLLRSGIGKVNAALSTTLLLEKYAPSAVINTGSAGGFNQALSVGDIVISDEVRYNDVDATAFGYAYGQVPQMPEAYLSDSGLVQVAKEAAAESGLTAGSGLILSGDSFMSDENRIAEIREKFEDPQCAEMEAGAIAQVCYRFETPFVVTRALSDIAGGEASVSFQSFLEKAAKESADLVMQMLPRLP